MLNIIKIGKIQIKATVSYHWLSITMPKSKKLWQHQMLERMGRTMLFIYIADGNTKWYCHTGKQFDILV